MSMPNNLNAARASLLAVMQSVPAVGQVHERERYGNSDAAFRKLYLYTHSDVTADAFSDQSHIRGWYLRRTATAESNANGRVLNEHTWLIRGFMAFKDEIASELIFDELIERVRAAVRVDNTLGMPGLIGGSVVQLRGVQVINAGPVLFAGALCHSAALELTTRSWAEWRK